MNLFPKWLLIAAFFCMPQFSMQEYASVDRLGAVQNFLRVMYPDLASQESIILRGRIETWSRLPVVNSSPFIKYEGALCSNLPVRAESSVISTTGLPPLSAERPRAIETLPHCAKSDWKADVEIWFDFGQQDGKYLVRQLLTKGEYFTGDIRKLEDSFRQKPAWTDAEGIARFKEVGAKFPPDAKETFLKQLDTKKLSQLTGCNLHPAETFFYTIHPAVEHSPRFTSVLRWVVPGKRRDGTDCQASFEPIHGRLVSVRMRVDPMMEKLGIYK